ncbi:hypothetical protein AMELA_G00249180 [Ameiurus melas]|uniref:C2H2-type domain-containing protein n=1 Tax=Ameiurus melas TaxID=219545 RepID=A0A7J5ZW22_AMEME|nr:hypothetical protein AMELA_G00249180 [Ameiurus melas]
MTKMIRFQLMCQNCNVQYEKIKDFKAHVRNYRHKQEVASLFQTAVHKGPVYFPMFVFLDYMRNPNHAEPLVGFDMMTMFITPEKIGALYLCHLCEDKLSSGKVVPHLCSDKHYSRYLAYTNPELLQFAWLSDSSYLQSSATNEYNTNGSGKLRVFELPGMMLRKCQKLPYDQVISVLSKTHKLMERIQAGIPWRKCIQEYIADPARTNPLLGLNLLLEYSCPKNEGYCGYLCILCKANFSATQSISHCISFDHVYSYLKAAHPATLDAPKSSYSHFSYSFHKKILYLANQAQTVCPPTEIQSVHLDLEYFKLVKSSSYASALEKLQVIWREKNQSELNFNITPGEQIMFAPEDSRSSASTVTTDRSAVQQEEKTQKEGPVTQTTNDPPCKILCVECDQTLKFIKDYKQHVKGKQHKQKLIELFGPGQYSGAVSEIKLYQFIWNRYGKTSFTPIIGLPFLTVFVQRHSVDFKTPPFYLCHACELNIPVSSTSIHLTSTMHYRNVFAYSKPDLVFLEHRDFTQVAQEEERSQGKQKMILQVCELPSQQFTELRTLAYGKFMETIGKKSPKLRKCVQVEKRVTLQSYSKGCERKSPLLGLQFIVKYSTTQHYYRCGYLCLLCAKKFSERHVIIHVLSFPHMFAYLNMAHPGSLNKEDSDQVALIMDVAQQAEKITPNLTLREVDLSFGKFIEIEKNSFMYAVDALQVVFRNKGLGELKPSVVPGARLVSSFETNKEHNASKCEKQGHTSSDSDKLNVDGRCTDTPVPKTEENMDSESPDLLYTEHEELQETPHITTTRIQPAEPSLATTHSDSTSSQPPITSLPKEQSAPLKLDQKSLNQERLPDHNSKEDVPTVKHPQPQDSCVPEQQSAELAPIIALQVEDLQTPAQFPAYLNSGTPAVPQTHLSTCTDLRSYLKTPNRQPVIGLKSVIECCTIGQQPFYMCITCAERCSESSIIRHILSHNHRLQYLKSLGIGIKQGNKKVMTKWLRAQAVMVENMEGSGETETINLDAENYHEISSARILSALGTLRDSLLKLTSEMNVQSPEESCSDNFKSDESHGPETFKTVKETEERGGPCPHLNETVKSTEPDTEPETPKQNDPARSSPYLWSYLTSPTRTEPVIGLSMITEYRNSNSQNSFLCSCCKVILPTTLYMDHLISTDHRFNYIKSKHPEFSMNTNNTQLQKKAQLVQDTEGWGCLKVVEKENKQPQKKSKHPSEDAENSGPDAKAQKLESSQAGGDAEPQDHNSLEPKPTKQQNKKKKNQRNAVIGLNFVTCVHHDKKKLFFCELCSVRGHLDHMSSVTHRETYVKHKFPGWTASDKNKDKKLHKIALRLSAVERSTGMEMKKLTVTAKVFTALRTAPLSEALSQLKLLQTKPKDGVDLQTPSSQPEPSTFLDREHGTLISYGDHICPAAITNFLQQEKSPLLENRLVPDETHCQDVTDIAPPYSSTLPTPVKITHHMEREEPPDVAGPAHPETGPGASTSYAESKGASGSKLTYRQSVLRNESELGHDTTPSKNYYFPNLPTVLGQSHASWFLHVKGLPNTVPIIGLSNILECRGTSQPTFFLCLNCAESVSNKNFCDHMTSERHQHLSISTQYHELVQQWQTIHQMTVYDLAQKLVLAEKGLDAKVIKLNQNLHESLRSADFHEAMEILQRIFGPCLDESSQPSCLTGQNRRSNEMVRSLPESVESEKERDHTSRQSHDTTTQIQEIHSSQVPLKDCFPEFDSVQKKLGKSSTACTSTHNQLQQSQSSPEALPETEAQTPQLQHQSVVHTGLTAESDRSSLHSHKPIAKRTKENPAVDGPNVTALETPESATEGSRERRPAHMSPHTPTIRQEETGHDEVYCGVDMTPTLEAKSSKEPTGNSLTHSDLKCMNKIRTEADAVVGLPAVIECRSEGRSSLYLCVSCSSKLDHDLINNHLIKSGHRYSYLKKRYPSLFEDWSDSDSRSERSMRLMRLAHKVEMTNEDEPGELQVMNLNCDDLKEIKGIPFDKAIMHLQKIRKEQNLCALKTCISPKMAKIGLIKQERIETDVTTQYSLQLPEMISQGPRRAVKRRAVERDLPHRLFSGKEQCSDVPSSHTKQSPAAGNNQEPSDLPVKQNKISGNDLDSVTQLQKESSILTTANPIKLLYCAPATVLNTSRSSPIDLDPSSQACKRTTSMDETLLQNRLKQESSSSIFEPQQTDSCPSTSTITALSPMKGQEIARLSEKRPLVKKSLSENVWNYENRQFSTETPSMTNTNPVADYSTEFAAMKQQSIVYSPHNYNEELNPHYNWKIPDTILDPNLIPHANANVFLPMVSRYATTSSVTSQMTPEYTVSHQYPMYTHPDYPSVIAVSNTMATDYLLPEDERTMNYAAGAPGVSTNGTYFPNANSAPTPHTVYQSQQMYQPIQSFQDPETYHAYYACCTYNQGLHTNQTAADSENVTSTPAFEHGVYPLARWPQKKN